LGDVLLIDSQNSLCSLATLASLTVYLAVSNRSVLLRHAAFRRAALVLRVAVATKRKARWQSANGLLVLATSYRFACAHMLIRYPADLIVYPPTSQHGVFAHCRSLTGCPRRLDRLPRGSQPLDSLLE